VPEAFSRHTVGHNLFVIHRDPDDHIIEFYAELDLMKDEDLGFFEPRPWHEFNPQRPRVWKLSESAPVWGMAPSPDFDRSHINILYELNVARRSMPPDGIMRSDCWRSSWPC